MSEENKVTAEENTQKEGEVSAPPSQVDLIDFLRNIQLNLKG